VFRLPSLFLIELLSELLVLELLLLELPDELLFDELLLVELLFVELLFDPSRLGGDVEIIFLSSGVPRPWPSFLKDEVVPFSVLIWPSPTGVLGGVNRNHHG
jgi:hypothetical protein